MEQFDKSFETLSFWKLAFEIRRKLKSLTESFPPEERHRLTDQIIRSSRSVTANIAEGYGRFHISDSIRFYYNARGSIFETLDHLLVAEDEGIIQKEDLENFRTDFKLFLKILNGYILYQKKLKDELENKNKKK